MNQEYTQRLTKIEAELRRWLPLAALEWSGSGNIETESQWMDDIFPGAGKDISAVSLNALLEPLNDILSRGGKRWRPLLMTLICEALGGGEASLPLAPLVEFSHTASLIHDDIEDDSDERRGKPAVHHIYGVDTAINSGSFLYFLSSACIDYCGGNNKETIYRLWTECMRRLHLGQAIDINWHREISFVPKIEEYYTMCAMKTGGLSRFAAEVGAHCAGATAETRKLLGEAAEKMGIGFQILDDVKNLTTGIPGKKRGDDIVEGKKSLPVLLYLHEHPEKRERIFYCFYEAKEFGVSVPEVGEMIEVLSQAGVLAAAEEKGKSLLEEARAVFTSLHYAGMPSTKEGRDLLDGLTSLIS